MSEDLKKRREALKQTLLKGLKKPSPKLEEELKQFDLEDRKAHPDKWIYQDGRWLRIGKYD